VTVCGSSVHDAAFLDDQVHPTERLDVRERVTIE